MKTVHSLEEALSTEFDCSALLERLLSFDIANEIDRNDGGMKLLGAYSLMKVLYHIKPTVYVELGSWKGLSLVLADLVLPPETQIFAFDVMPKNLQFKPERAKFSDREWASPVYGGLTDGAQTSLLFADDHQDALERLLTAWSRNFDYVLFDDDYGDRADHRTMRNALMKDRVPSAIGQLLGEIVEFACPIGNPLPEVEKSGLFGSYSTHWRDQVLVKLRKPGVLGWTMGAPYWRP